MSDRTTGRQFNRACANETGPLTGVNRSAKATRCRAKPNSNLNRRKYDDDALSSHKTAVCGSVALATPPNALAQTNSTIPTPSAAVSSANLRRTEPARAMLANSILPEVHRMAHRLLKGSLNAGSNYDQVWIRDLNTFIEVEWAAALPLVALL